MRRFRVLLSLPAGASATLAFAPFSLPLFALLSPALLWWLLRGQSPRQALLYGWLYGLGFFGAGVSWVYVSIHQYGGAPALLAGGLTFAFCAALALLFALQSWLGARFVAHPRHGWLGFVGLWWLFEWLRSWLLTGFPWLYLGYAFTDTPMRTLASVTGVWGLSLLALLLAAGTVEAVHRRRLQPLLPGTLLLALTWLLPAQWTPPAGAPISVAVVQPNVPQLMKWQPAQRQAIIDQLLALSAPHLDADLIVWPENAVPALYSQVAPQLSALSAALADAQATLITGLPTRRPDPDAPGRSLFHNSLLLLGHDSGVYHKRRLVPFGEYVPLEQWLRGVIAFFDLPMSAFSLPREPQPPLRVQGQVLAAAICYEIAYPELVRRSSTTAGLILTVSNDTWFGRSIGPDQHLQMARMRALENGRWVIRGTNNGITALIDPQGEVRARAPVDDVAVLTGEAVPMQGRTPYQRWGIWPLLGADLLLLLTLLITGVRTAPKQYRPASTGLDR